MTGHGRTVLILLAIFTALAAPVLAAGEGDALATDNGEETPLERTVTMYGYVTKLSDVEENTPLEGVMVTLYSGESKNILDTVTTNSDGRFQFIFEYDHNGLYSLSFDYLGYTVRSLPDLEMEMDVNGHVQFNLRPNMVDADGMFALTGTADGPHAIVMVVTTGHVFGTVQGTSDDGTFNPEGATVTLTSATGQSVSAVTNSNGYFEIECPFGTYTLTVQCNGFQDSEPLTVESGGPGTAYNVVLDQNTSNVFFGLDIAHAVMLIGLVIFVIILIPVAYMHLRSKGGDDTILMNDLDKITKQQDDEDVRRL